MNMGATIERGEIIRTEKAGYSVRSFTRDGVVTPLIPASGEANYANGDLVYFFMFEDGHGLIIAKMN